MKQRTIRNRIEVSGVGLHTGEMIRLILEPLNNNSGIVFYRSDLFKNIPLSIENVLSTEMATVLGDKEGSISTVEHLLSAISAFGIDNLRVSVDNKEIPIMDGSSISFCMLINEAGIKEQEADKVFLKIKQEVFLEEGEKVARISPSLVPKFSFDIDFKNTVIGKESIEFTFSLKDYVQEISRARTFGFVKDIQYLKNNGLALGASLNNAIAVDEGRILNAEGLRYDNEFVRHKVLDAIGDLRVIGYNIVGDYYSFAGGHNLNSKLIKKILSDQKNYELVNFSSKQEQKNYSLAYAMG